MTRLAAFIAICVATSRTGALSSKVVRSARHYYNLRTAVLGFQPAGVCNDCGSEFTDLSSHTYLIDFHTASVGMDGPRCVWCAARLS